MKFLINNTTFLLLFIFSTALVRAQSDKNLDTLQIISEKRLFGENIKNHGRNVEVITAKEIAKLPVQTVNEALAYLAGVDVRQRGPIGGQADISMLGGTFEQVLILVNGIPMRDPQTGHHTMNLPVDLQMIERIEVIKGTASRTYGANAMNGAINIVTKDPASERVFAQFYAAAPFENDTASGDAYYAFGYRAGVGFKTHALSNRVDLSYQETNGYRYNSGSEQIRLNYLGRAIIKDDVLDIMAGTLNNKFGANQFYSPTFDKNSFEQVSTSYAALKYNTTRGGIRIAPLAYWRYNHDDYDLRAFNYRNNHFTTATGAEIHLSKQFEKYSFAGGLESRAELIRSNNLGKHERFFYAAYGEMKRKFKNEAQLTLGLNAQYNSDFQWRVYPGIEFNTPLVESIHLFANAGLANRLPTYTDLYYSDRSTLGNANLLPENALQAEIGFRRTLQNLRLQASGFIRNTDDFIDFVQDSIGARFVPRNFQEVVVRGGEFSGTYFFPNSKEQNFGITAIRAGYTYLDATINVTNVVSRYALEHLRHQLSVQLSLKTTKLFEHTASIRYMERFKGQEYAVIDYRIRMNQKNWNIFVDASNLLDRQFIEAGFVPMPGRWFRIGAEFNLK
ncbi:MAG: TonB-dependent receptor plug domain-containing protein [Flavobacteriales bacterium]|jgi:vitamin B12 transporter